LTKSFGGWRAGHCCLLPRNWRSFGNDNIRRGCRVKVSVAVVTGEGRKEGDGNLSGRGESRGTRKTGDNRRKGGLDKNKRLPSARRGCCVRREGMLDG